VAMLQIIINRRGAGSASGRPFASYAAISALTRNTVPTPALFSRAVRRTPMAGTSQSRLSLPPNVLNSDYSSVSGSGASESGGIHVGDISQGDLATGQLQGATSAAATVDAFTQSIVLGANIQNNSFTLALTGGDSHVSATDIGGGHSHPV
jgi:hypothetical protein